MKYRPIKYLVMLAFPFLISIAGSSKLTARIDSAKADIGVVFSEILYNSADSGEDVGEWIELYNSTASNVNLGGWTIRDNYDTYTIPDCTVIPSKGYLVITSGRSYFFSQYGFYPHLSNLTLELSNVDDFLTLKDKQGSVRDRVAWEAGGTHVSGWGSTTLPKADEGKTIVRSSFTLDTDAYADWANNQTPSPSNNSLPAGSPEITLSTAKLTFDVISGGDKKSQTFTVSNSACGTLNWTAKSEENYITCEPGSGTGSGVVTVTVNPASLDPGTYTGTVTFSAPDASNSPQTVSVTVNVSEEKPLIWLSRTQLYFGAAGGIVTCGEQAFLIENTRQGTLNWNVASNADWLVCSPPSGAGSGMVIVSLDSSVTGFAIGTYSGVISVGDPNAVNSPQTVSVTLIVHAVDAPPFGIFATPEDNSIVRSSIPVTGWVLDDVGVESVKLYRHTTGGNGLTYVGDAVFVEGARPDVEQAFPQYPLNYKAGWGYMLLTHFLSTEGDGTYIIEAIAGDCGGKTVSLGTKTITVDNANAIKPFGAIDTPAQGGSASGNGYRNHGWVLTPLPNMIAVDGSTIDVYIDGVYLGHPVYNIYRSDIADRFPGYANSSGAHAYFDFDTAEYSNGVHTIYWTAEDSSGNSDGIGSRYFSILNVGGNRSSGNRAALLTENFDNTPLGTFSPVKIIKGFKQSDEPAVLETVYPGDSGIITIDTEELERVEVHFPGVICTASPLPVGSTLDTQRGIFYWQPGPGFIGDYEYEFINVEGTNTTKIRLRVRIEKREPCLQTP
jgi:hypothetical protein